VELLAPQLNATECGTTGATPVPLNATLEADVVALLSMCTLPAAAPPDDGANCTLTDVLWFGDSVTAPAPLTIEYPVPAAVIPEIATFELPVFVTVNPCAAELPSATLPKLRLPGFTLIVYDAATPVALSATAAAEFGALLIIETAPLTLPVDCGLYCTLKFPLWPGVSVMGSANPLKLKPAPVTVACETVKFAVPLFLSCTVCEFVFPVTTEPKLALVGVRLNPACACVPVNGCNRVHSIVIRHRHAAAGRAAGRRSKLHSQRDAL